MLQRDNCQPWRDVNFDQLGRISVVCFDIDDTFTTKGKITANAFSSLWRLKEAGFLLIAITGRAAGSCDHIVRFWPVDAVVGENGAFTFYMEDGVRKRFDTLGDNFEKYKKQLNKLRQKILKKFPGSTVASDQNYRDYDLAIDICEDVPPWSSVKTQDLINLCISEGAKAKLSSIHVNTWFGEYDKAMGLNCWIEAGAPGFPITPPPWDEWIFIGDSPNDAPMFSFFKNSVGVGNIAPYLNKMENVPSWITEKSSGDGFEEFANTLCKLKEDK